MVQTTLLKFNDRLPFEKTAQHISEVFDLSMTSATALEITNRVSQTLRPNYQEIFTKYVSVPLSMLMRPVLKLMVKSGGFGVL